jgi:sugar lactone lactonase YvrE
MSDVSVSVFAGGLDHPEGVAAWGDNSLVAGGEAGQIYLIDAKGDSRQIADTGGYCLGIAVDGEGSLYVCDMGRHAVLRYSREGDVVEDLTTGISEEQVRVPNYPVFDASGRLYFSDSRDWGDNNGVLFVRHPDGRVEVASREVNGYTNGLAIDPQQDYLYVVESSVPAITRCVLHPDGALGPREIYVSMERQVPDGIAFTHDGALLIACYRPDAVYLFRDGTLELLVNDEKGLSISAPTNIAFFGERLTRLAYANLAGNFVGEIHSDLVGAPLNYPVMSK